MNDFTARATEAMNNGKIIGDGHTLFSPEFYAPFFSAEELNEAGLIHTHESDGTHKGSIYDQEGNILTALTAVYNLSFLYWVVGKLGITDYRNDFFGRGSQAQELASVIRKHLKEISAQEVAN